ncbi:hypothetical protein C8J57DRAFT_250210 [Mycena rebaudengoi]|nr:hypothetical protein C8J57DRAFT_250210 [Mycena rebaudengoi]
MALPASAILRCVRPSLAAQLTSPPNFRGARNVRSLIPRAPTDDGARLYLSTTSHPRAMGPKPTPNAKPTSPEPTQRVSLDDLGATRTVKVVIYVTIAVLATVETFVWAKAGWRWYAGKPESEGEA